MTARAAAQRAAAALRRCAGGNVVVEFALLLAPVLLVILCFFELGRYFFVSDSLANAAREAARMAIVRGATSDDPVTAEEIAAFVKAQAPGLVDPAQLAVTVTYQPNNSPGSKVFVQIDYPFAFLAPGIGGLPTLTMSKVASMTISR